jgi:hypothetical protein
LKYYRSKIIAFLILGLFLSSLFVKDLHPFYHHHEAEKDHSSFVLIEEKHDEHACFIDSYVFSKVSLPDIDLTIPNSFTKGSYYSLFLENFFPAKFFTFYSLRAPPQ